MSEIPWKAGEEYEMREMGRFRVYATDGGGDFPIHGAALYPSIGWRAECRTADGRAVAGVDSPDDLMPPKRVIWVNIYDDGVIIVRKSEAEARANSGDNCVTRLRVEYTPGQFDE